MKTKSNAYAQAERDFERVIDLEPGNGEAYRRLGMTYDSAGLSSEALAALQKAAQVRPDGWKTFGAISP